MKNKLGELDMSTYAWLVCGLAAFDVFLVVPAFLLAVSLLNDRKSREVTAIAISGFVFHAFMFSDGAFLYVQLATLAVFYIALAFWPFKQQSTGRASNHT